MLEANAKSAHAQPGSGSLQDEEEGMLLEMLKGLLRAREHAGQGTTSCRVLAMSIC